MEINYYNKQSKIKRHLNYYSKLQNFMINYVIHGWWELILKGK